MRKSEIIAQCLINSSMINSLEGAENKIISIFKNEFPNSSYSKWNTELSDKVAERIISSVGRASRINVKKFIEDL